MYINIEMLKTLINDNFNNNLHQFARTLEMSPSTISRVVNGNSNAGTKFLGNFMNYCKAEGLDFNEFIFLPELLHAANSVLECNVSDNSV